MNRHQELVERRAVLIDRIAFQRRALADEFREFEQRSSLVEKGYSLAQGVRSHPKLAVASSVAALFVLRKLLPVGMFTGTALTLAKAGFSFARNKLLARKTEA